MCTLRSDPQDPVLAGRLCSASIWPGRACPDGCARTGVTGNALAETGRSPHGNGIMVTWPRWPGEDDHDCAAADDGAASPVGSGADRAVLVTGPPRRRGHGPGVPGPVH